jgi:hypothetical protein
VARSRPFLAGTFVVFALTIRTSAALAVTDTAAATLTPDQENPRCIAADGGSGNATFTFDYNNFDAGQRRRVTGTLQFRTQGTPTSAGIFEGAPASPNGSTLLFPIDIQDAGAKSQTIAIDADMDPDTITDIAAASAFVNVMTDLCPGGEIRGQLGSICYGPCEAGTPYREGGSSNGQSVEPESPEPRGKSGCNFANLSAHENELLEGCLTLSVAMLVLACVRRRR